VVVVVVAANRRYLVVAQQDCLPGAVELGSIWVFTPLKGKLFALKRILTHPSVKELAWIGSYAEERSATQSGLLVQPSLPTADGPQNNMIVSPVNPCLVVTEHDTLTTARHLKCISVLV
jgi:hypothetical protein